MTVDFNTFSVVGRCARTGDFGVAAATARPAVGSVVPWASLAGAVATQARTNTALGFVDTLREHYGDDGLRRYRRVKL